ncbi:MAG: hypothetical protein K8T89_05030 [Planctomycetes bacterium]|nr:hypothetical protein [Planctomycetota bacterium]
MRLPKRPVSPEAAAALALAIFAVGLAILGVYSPWGALRFPVEMKLHGTNAVLAYGGTCVLPIFLGLGAAGLAGLSYRSMERSQGKLGGEGPAFFSLLTSLFAVVIGACTTFATLIWPNI